MNTSRRLLWSGAAALVLTVAGGASAFAYEGQVPDQITITARCVADSLAATVTDTAGVPVPDLDVSFAFIETPDENDVIAPTTAMTDAAGKATTGLDLTGTPGRRVIEATAGEVSARATLVCAGPQLPNTSAGTSEADGSPSLMAATLVMLIGFVAAYAAIWRRRPSRA